MIGGDTLTDVVVVVVVLDATLQVQDPLLLLLLLYEEGIQKEELALLEDRAANGNERSSLL
jgi:hypothetical protein